MHKKINLIINILLIVLGCLLTGLAFISKVQIWLLNIFGAQSYIIFPTTLTIFCILFFVKLYIVGINRKKK